MSGAGGGRSARIAAVGYDYRSAPQERLKRCNLCGGERFVTLTHRDRYGFPAAAQGCLGCGLVFMNPRLTPSAYRAFYQSVYRPLVSAFHGRLIDAETLQAEQREYAEERAEVLGPYVESRHRRLLDVGGSTGVVAHALARRFGWEATVLDPAPLEIERARQLGLETIAGLVEDYQPAGRLFDVVTLCQTADHLLDLRGTLCKLRELVDDGGRLFLDIVDFRAAYLRHLSVEAAVKVDHPYALTESTAEACLARSGWRVLHKDYAADALHVSYVCQPGRPDPDALPPAELVREQWREIRAVQNRGVR